MSEPIRPAPIPFAAPDIGEEEIAAVADAMRSGWLTTGPAARAFEEEFAAFVGGGRTAVAVNSATAGLHLALEAMGVGPGDEVLVPTWTFTASAEVVRYLGADPVVVDVDAASLNIDLDAAEAAITTRTRAIIPVHFAGLPVDASRLGSLARRRGLRVLEDAAHAFPASSAGTTIGAGASDAVVFSFYATKTMTTGEGGMVLTGDPDLAARVRTMRLHGISRDVFARYAAGAAASSWAYDVVAPGYKYNLTDPAAAMGRVQLRRARSMRDARAATAARYDEAFAGLPVDLPPHAPPGSEHAWHLYVLRLRHDAPVSRDTFIEAMAQRGIGCSVHFTPLHRLSYWRDTYDLDAATYPRAEAAFAGAVSLPLSSALTPAQVDRVVGAVREILGGGA